jgi:hypothetical protein
MIQIFGNERGGPAYRAVVAISGLPHGEVIILFVLDPSKVSAEGSLSIANGFRDVDLDKLPTM